jgi:hypothetical protein
MARDTIPSARRPTSHSEPQAEPGCRDRSADLLFEAHAVHLPANALFSGTLLGHRRLFFEQTAIGMLQLRENVATLPRL